MNTGERPVDEGRVLMTMKHLRAGARGDPRHVGRKTSMKSRASIQNVERHAVGTQHVTPRAGFVKAADRLPGRARRATDELDDQPLCSAGRKGKNDLKDGWLWDEALPVSILPPSPWSGSPVADSFVREFAYGDA
jgi:hypothetical protein